MKKIIASLILTSLSMSISAGGLSLLEPLRIMGIEFEPVFQCEFRKATPGNILTMMDRYHCMQPGMEFTETGVFQSESGRIVTKDYRHTRAIDCRNRVCKNVADGEFAGRINTDTWTMVYIPHYYYFHNGTAYQFGHGPLSDTFFAWNVINENYTSSHEETYSELYPEEPEIYDEECFESWVTAYRREEGEDALINYARSYEWKTWCNEGKTPINYRP